MQLRLLVGLAVLQGACAHTTSSAPPTRAAEVHVDTVPISERGLYDIIMQLASDAAAQAKLAPAARVVFHGETTTSEPLTDARKELGWVSEANPKLVSSAEPTLDADVANMRCVVAELRCSIEQEGGETIFRFVYIGEGVERRVVLSMIESAEP